MEGSTETQISFCGGPDILRDLNLNGLTLRLERAIRWSRVVSASPGGRFPQTRMAMRV